MFPFNLSIALDNPAALESLRETVRTNATRGLRTVCVLSHDNSNPLDIGQPDALVLRTSMVRNMRYEEEFIIPVVTPTRDFPATMHKPRDYATMPRIGFMGAVPRMSMRLEHAPEGNAQTSVPGSTFQGYEPIDAADARVVKTPVNIGTVIRSRAIKSLAQSQVIVTDIVVRDKFFGFQPEKDRPQLRNEYVDHLMRNDYILCPRGAGNFSIRLYETMAAGRIPILIDTDLVMPFPEQIPWPEIAVWVPISDIDNIDEHVIRFHERLGSAGHREIQSRIRRLFNAYLSKNGRDGYLEKFLLERT